MELLTHLYSLKPDYQLLCLVTGRGEKLNNLNLIKGVSSLTLFAQTVSDAGESGSNFVFILSSSVNYVQSQPSLTTHLNALLASGL